MIYLADFLPGAEERPGAIVPAPWPFLGCFFFSSCFLRFSSLAVRTVASRRALRRSGFSDFLALRSSMDRPAIPRDMAVEVTILFLAFLRTSSWVPFLRRR